MKFSLLPNSSIAGSTERVDQWFELICDCNQVLAINECLVPSIPTMPLVKYLHVERHPEQIRNEFTSHNARLAKHVELWMELLNGRRNIKGILWNQLRNLLLRVILLKHLAKRICSAAVVANEWLECACDRCGLQILNALIRRLRSSMYGPRNRYGHGNGNDAANCLCPSRPVNGFGWRCTPPSVEQAPSQKHAKSSAYGADDEQVSSCDRFLHGCQCSPDVVGRSLVRALRKWGAA